MPKYRECSVDEFLAQRKPVTRDGIVYRAAGAPKTFNAEERSQVFVMSSEDVDSYGDIVKAGGADLYRFEKNPIALLNHRADMILGTWSDVQKKPQRLEGKVTLAKEGTAPHVDMAYNLMGQGILRGASIGFMPTRLEVRLDDDGNPMWCYLIHEWELYECSVVSIPANPSALARSIGDGDDLIIARDYVEQVLDGWARSPEGLLLPREEYERAYKVTVEKVAADEIAPAAADATEAMDEKAVDDEIEVFRAFVAEMQDGDVISRKADIVEVDSENGYRCFEKRSGSEIFSISDVDGTLKHSLSVEAITSDHEEIIVARIAEVEAAKAAASSENKPETETAAAPVTLTLNIDDGPAKQKIEGLTGLLTKLADKFPAFFPKAVTEIERIEPVIVPAAAPVAAPDPVAAHKALENAVLLRARLATKGRLAA